MCPHSRRNSTDGSLTAAGTILNVTYGYTVKDCDDPLVTLADECTSASVAAGGPGAMLCDLVPARTSPNVPIGIQLRTFPAVKYWPTWAPFSGFKKHALETKSLVERFFNEPLQWVKARVVGPHPTVVAMDVNDLHRRRAQHPHPSPPTY